MGAVMPLVPLISALVSGAGVASSTVLGIKSGNAQERAQKKARKLQEEANAKANQKTPDAQSILAAAQKGGGSSTMLTDPTSAPSVTLGKSTLLGG